MSKSTIKRDFFCAINSSSKLDKFASFVIDRLEQIILALTSLQIQLTSQYNQLEFEWR